MTTTIGPDVERDDYVDAFDLDVQFTGEVVAAGALAPCTTGDGCAPSCASSCTSD